MQISTCDTAAAGNGVRGRPRMATVFGAAFVAGALAAFGINRALDVHLAQARPQVECEPIFVALRALPQGTPLTVWDVALRDWPKAMLPTTALRAHDTFEGMVLRHPLREGQPLVAAQLVKADESGPSARVAGAAAWPAAPAPAVEPWTPARPAEAPSTAEVATAAVAPLAAAPDSAPTTIAAAPATDPAAQPVAAATETAAVGGIASEPPVGEPAAGDRFAVPGAAPVADSAPLVAADVAAVEPRPAPPAAHEFGTDSTTTTAFPDAAAAVTDLPATGPDLVDELPPSDAATATVTDVVALPAVAAADAPTLADPPPAEAAVADAAGGPLVAPVPMSPPTDIESPLASITGSRPRAATPAAPESSVLERSEPVAAQPPPPSAPLRYLVVPERIALQADASFVMPQQPAADRAGPGTNREASVQQRTRPRGSGPSPRSAGSAASADGQRRPAAGAPRQAGPGRPEPTPPKAGSWLPKLGFGVFGSGGAR